MTSLRLAGIPGDLLLNYPHQEISHCIGKKKSPSVLDLGDNRWLPPLGDGHVRSQKFDLAVANLASMPSLASCLNQITQELNASGYFGLIFFHLPRMQDWFVYEIEDSLREIDQRNWEEGCRLLDQFLGEGKIQVVEREIIQISPNFLENTDLVGLFERHHNSFADCFDELVLDKIKHALHNVEDFLESSNSNLDLFIESIFGVKEW